LALARRGTSVAVNFSHSAAEATETVERIRKEGGLAHSMRADVSRSEDVDRLISNVLDKFGQLDLLVNAAGVPVRIDFSNLDGIDEHDWDRIMAVNVKGAWLASRAAARVMQKQGTGSHRERRIDRSDSADRLESPLLRVKGGRRTPHEVPGGRARPDNPCQRSCSRFHAD
jgi:NAD(P)-dependent dehydrogenase (short-subunit alcohol dehydrogenase family)